MCREYRDEHRQLAKWLEELKECQETIRRQKVEIERLNIELQSMRSATNSYKIHYETAKSEAVKGFMEKFKRKATVVHKTHSGKHWYEIDDDEIDNILKEIMIQP